VIPRLCYWTDGPRGSGGRDPVEVIERLAVGGVELVEGSRKRWPEHARRVVEAVAHQHGR